MTFTHSPRTFRQPRALRRLHERTLAIVVAAGAHYADTDCTVGPDGCCTSCHVLHGDPCPACGQRAYHAPGCPNMNDAETYTAQTKGPRHA